VTVKKKVYGVASVLLLTLSATAGFLLVNFASADYGVLTIYIRSDGNVEGTDLIERNGNVYTFKGDIGVFNQTISANTYLGGIVVERDNIVIDGAGYKLTGSGLYCDINPFYNPPIQITKPGIDTTGRSNIIIENITIQAFAYGIRLQRSTNITVLNSDILQNEKALSVYNSMQLTLINSKIYGTRYGVYFQNATRCLIYNNTFADNQYGIETFPSHSSDEVSSYGGDHAIVSNQFIGNSYAIEMGASSYNIFSDNIIQNGSSWSPPEGFEIYSVPNIIFGSSYILSDNIIQNGSSWSPLEGIDIGGNGNIVCGNHISGNKFAIQTGGKDNLFYRNNIVDNTIGVVLYGGINMTFFSNNFFSNENDVQGSSVSWNKGSVGNYWSKYNGSDWTRDGKGDTPYVINSENQDDYPNMAPFNIDGTATQLPAWAQEKLRSLGIAVEEPTQETTPEPFPTALVIAASGTSIAIIGVGLFFYFRKHKIKSGITHA
jgi:parallel beta-helix repeat protein